jgi:hypothetical protein
VAVTATDGVGTSAAGTASVTVVNTAPVLGGVTLTPTNPTRRSTLSCTGSATDADADSPSLTFNWTVDGAPVTATSTSATLSTLAGVFAAGQLVACTVTADDGKGGSDTDSASVVIENTAPIVSGVTLSPSTVYTNDTLTATATTSDDDGDTLSVTYDWYVDGDLVQSGAASTLSGASHFDRDEVVYVTGNVDDGTESTTATSASITVSNSAPTAPVVAITPSDAASGDDLTCELVTESTDADGDPISYTFAWDVDGTAYTDATDSEMSSFVDGADVGGGETWTCEVGAGDGDAETPSTDSVMTPQTDCASVTWTLGQTISADLFAAYPSDWTVEGWFKPDGTYSSTWGGSIVGVPGNEVCGTNDYNVSLGSDGTVHARGSWYARATTTNTSSWRTDQWFHFALERRSDGTGWLYVDGRLAQSYSATGGPAPACAFYIGSSPGSASNYVGGTLAALRFSSTLRYSATFTPPVAFEADGDTIWLFQFDEMSGAAAADDMGGPALAISPFGWSTQGPTCTE